jgi:threonine/homoserine/homoserine lactone efflux protein
MTIALLALTAIPFVVSPGASFAITVDAASTGDRLAAVKVWAGTALGITVLASVTAVSGIGEFFAQNDIARTIFGVAGGVVLVALGASSLVKALRSFRQPLSATRASGRLILWSFLALITNVKALSLYVLVVPGLGATATPGPAVFFVFASVHVVLLLAWLTLLSAGVCRISSIGTSPRIRAGLLGLAATTLIIIGGRDCCSFG